MDPEIKKLSLLLPGLMLAIGGCLAAPASRHFIPISPQQVRQLEGVTSLYVFADQAPPFLVAFPSQTISSFPPIRNPSFGDAVRLGQEIPAESWLGNPVTQLRDHFVPLWQQAAGLTEVAPIQRWIEQKDIGHVIFSGGSQDAALFLRVWEWGLYYYPPEDRYFLQLAAQVDLMRPSVLIRWSAVCMRNTGTVPLGEWKTDEGRLLKTRFAELVQLCSGDLLRQFPSRG